MWKRAGQAGAGSRDGSGIDSAGTKGGGGTAPEVAEGKARKTSRRARTVLVGGRGGVNWASLSPLLFLLDCNQVLGFPAPSCLKARPYLVI